MPTDDSYYVDTTATEGAVEGLNQTAATVGQADAYLQAMITLPAPVRGDGIGASVGAFQVAWHEALPQIQKELQNLTHNVNTATTLVVTAERLVQGHFSRFAN